MRHRAKAVEDKAGTDHVLIFTPVGRRDAVRGETDVLPQIEQRSTRTTTALQTSSLQARRSQRTRHLLKTQAFVT